MMYRAITERAMSVVKQSIKFSNVGVFWGVFRKTYMENLETKKYILC